MSRMASLATSVFEEHPLAMLWACRTVEAVNITVSEFEGHRVA